MIEISDRSIDAAAALQQFSSKLAGAGAIVSFTGIVRGTSGGDQVHSLLLQQYAPMTENAICSTVECAKERWTLDACTVRHRTGLIAAGDTIVFVATAAAHRRDAFEAADFIMDYLKTEAIFWKKELTSNGEAWIEPRTEDYSDRARWGDL